MRSQPNYFGDVFYTGEMCAGKNVARIDVAWKIANWDLVKHGPRNLAKSFINISKSNDTRASLAKTNIAQINVASIAVFLNIIFI